MDIKNSTSKAAKVAYQGVDGSYSSMAALSYFAQRDMEVDLEGFDSFRSMLEAVSHGTCRYGVLPLENSTSGSINEAYDLLASSSLSIVGEIVREIHHCLLGLAGSETKKLKMIYSHPQALSQCSEFLYGLNHVVAQAYLDTAMAARKIIGEGSVSQGAIASEEVGQSLGLKVLERNLSNTKENYTRFVIVSRQNETQNRHLNCKTTLVFKTKHQHGALVDILSHFKTHRVNLSKLESRPQRESPWTYLFYVDLEGHRNDAHVCAALHKVERDTDFMYVLGSYNTFR